jgi:hypothetical protein
MNKKKGNKKEGVEEVEISLKEKKETKIVKKTEEEDNFSDFLAPKNVKTEKEETVLSSNIMEYDKWTQNKFKELLQVSQSLQKVKLVLDPNHFKLGKDTIKAGLITGGLGGGIGALGGAFVGGALGKK